MVKKSTLMIHTKSLLKCKAQKKADSFESAFSIYCLLDYSPITSNLKTGLTPL